MVRQYLVGDIGFKALGQRHGVGYSQIKRWVYLYQAHGSKGLVKKLTCYNALEKLEILEFMWANQLSYAQATTHFNIRSPGVIPAWERCYHSGGLDALVPRKRGRPKKMPELPPPPKTQPPAEDDIRSREELLAEVNYLRMENAYLKKLKALVQQQTAAPKKRK